MSTIKRMAFDGASFCWRGLLASKDGENGYEVEFNGKPKWINSAQWGYDKVLSYVHEHLKASGVRPVDTILVLEGQSSKVLRLAVCRSYKEGKDKAEAQYAEFVKLRDMLRRFWLDLGGQVLTQDRAEGDDVLGWLAKNTEDDLIIATYDNDISVLNGLNAYGARVQVWVDMHKGRNKYGTFPASLITTYKALVGDTSDNIKGCHGFGEAKFFDFVNAYGIDGLQQLQDMLEQGDLSDLSMMAADPAHKLVRKIYEQADKVIESYQLAKIHPEWVDTMMTPLKWEAGMVRQRRKNEDPRFAHWYGQSYLVTGKNFNNSVQFALPLIHNSREVALDIETSGCDESDEWLANLSRTGDEDDAGVDVFGHKLTGLSLTFGDNNQYSMYFSVDHADTPNVDSEKLRQFIALIEKPLIIHNMNFELTVLFNEWGPRQLDNGFHGFLPNVLDTALSCAYTNENVSRGLKFRSKMVLGYDQVSYKETTELSGPEGTLFKGGKLLALTEPEYETMQVGTGVREPLFDMETGLQAGWGEEVTKTVLRLDENGEKILKTPPIETRRYRMNELPAKHVLGYGCDDTITTIAHHNHNRLRCQLEHQWQTYLDVEIGAAYQHAKNFVDGICFSLEKMNLLQRLDNATHSKAWATVRQYLIAHGWAGTTPPVYTPASDPAAIKEAFKTVTGRQPDTLMRTPSKLVTYIREVEGETVFAGYLEQLYAGDAEPFTRYVNSKFKGEPVFNFGSAPQKQRLLYDVMGFPIKARNKPTKLMKAAGEMGSAKTDNLALAYALREADDETKLVLEAMALIGMVTTRRNLFYNKYPNFPHWKDGRIHSQHNQSSTNTRRASSSKPNMQQLPKHQKIEGQASRFRETIVPHRPDAVIVSIDFKAQELRLIADYSRDPVMLSMYIGDNLRDQHTLTGLAIAQRKDPDGMWTYESFASVLKHKEHPNFQFCKDCRNLGKKLNFTAEYGAMAEKVATTLMITVEEAQEYLDAREAMFTLVTGWKQDIINEAKEFGFVRTKMGAVRHLREALNSDDRSVSSKAERQAVNYMIQGSSGEQTKMAEGRMWRDNLFFDFDAVCYGPVHDEVCASVRICDLYDFLPRMHAAMVAPYGDMDVPIEGDISFGPSYGEQIEIGAAPSREAIDKGLEELKKLTHKEAA